MRNSHFPELWIKSLWQRIKNISLPVNSKVATQWEWAHKGCSFTIRAFILPKHQLSPKNSINNVDLNLYENM